MKPDTAWPRRWRIYALRREKDNKYEFGMARSVAARLADYQRRGVEIWLVAETSAFQSKRPCQQLLTAIRHCRTIWERLTLIQQNSICGRLLGITCPASKPIIR